MMTPSECLDTSRPKKVGADDMFLVGFVSLHLDQIWAIFQGSLAEVVISISCTANQRKDGVNENKMNQSWKLFGEHHWCRVLFTLFWRDG